jgi:phenylalanyl-tRNA synthetase alpha chain
MSGPNTDYDPVEVTPLHADEVDRRRDEALAAIAAAGSLDALKQVRLAHAGDRSPLALANREIGSCPRRRASRPGCASARLGPRSGQPRPATGRARGRGRGADAGRRGRRRHGDAG